MSAAATVAGVDPLPFLDMLRTAARILLAVWTWVAFGYTIALQLFMLAFVATSGRLLSRARPATRPGRTREVANSAFPAGVSVVMPAYNEEAGILPSVQAMLQMEYPVFEVIVVNDGSKDNTLGVLVDAFDLSPVETGPAPYPELTTNPVRALYLPANSAVPLRVIDKEPGGNKAYVVNCGISAAVHPYVVVVDADSLIAPDAVTRIIAELTSSEEPLLGAGGTIMPANDCVIVDGRVVDARVPHSFIAACQLAEYLRSFIVGRAAFGAARSVAIISGALGVFRRSDVLAIGGYTPGHLGEDLDMTVRLQRRAADMHLPSGLAHVPEALLWTEVPETRRTLARQRVRWHRGLLQVMREHRATVGNRRFGRFGMFGMTYMLLFEYAAPVIEATGYLTLLAAIWLHAVNATVAFALFGLTLLAGFANTVQAIWLEERHFRLYHHRTDLVRLILIALAEQLGYRQLTVWWRLKAIFARGDAWGAQTRRGLGTPAARTIPGVRGG